MSRCRALLTVVVPVLVVGMGAACQPTPSAQLVAAPENQSEFAVDETPGPAATSRRFVVISRDDPAAAYAPHYATTVDRELAIGHTAEVIEMLDGAVDVVVVSSRGHDPVVSRKELPAEVRVSRLLVAEPDGWAVRVARSAERVVLSSDPSGDALSVGDAAALVPLPDDLRAPGPVNSLITTTDAVVELAPRDRQHQWLVDTVRTAPELPGGGHLLFPGKRLVAVYGHPTTPSLGVLGEQGIDATIERARSIADAYAADDLVAVPAFDMITTIAAAEAGDDGDYSRETPIETLRPWVDAARDAGVYVVLDLQPGRTDFLTQARRYEELLREPHVGLALDPEWRLGPNQVHLRQIGSVNAIEVNAVADWLADLVRSNALPQKLFMVHQFKLTMIADRDLLDTSHPELAHVIQMDGQGPIGTKDETYAALTRGFEDRVWWGWKNFYDEDLPTPSPEHTMTRTPEPVFVSYQ